MMETIIPCRNCDHPLKSGSCLGCNVFRLYEALQRGKLDWAKDEHNGIVESKLEQPTLSPNEVRGVGKWIEVEQPMGWRDEPCAECSVCGEDFVLGELDMKDIRNLFRFCPNCGAKMEVSEDA